MFLTKTRAPYHPISISTWTAPPEEVTADLSATAAMVYEQSQMRVPTYTQRPVGRAAVQELFREPWYDDPAQEAPLLPWFEAEMGYFAEAMTSGEAGPAIYISCIPEMCSLSYDETNRQHVDEFINHIFDHCAPARAFVVFKREDDGQMSISLTSGYGIFHAYQDVLDKIKQQSPAFLPGGALWPNPDAIHPDIHPEEGGGETEPTTPDPTDPEPEPETPPTEEGEDPTEPSGGEETAEEEV